MKRKVLSLLLTLAMCLTLAGCGGEKLSDLFETAASVEEDSGFFKPGGFFMRDEPEPSDATWAVYWYLCGSDLESRCGYASYDLSEMMEVQLPENVKVVIQTGGTYVWQN